MQGGSRRLVMGGVWGGLHLPTGVRSGEGAMPLPSKKLNFHFKWRVLVDSKRYFLSVSVPEKC